MLFEPGRSLIGPAGITLYKIGAIKPIEKIKTYLFVDGGMADNPRPITYGANYTFDTVVKKERPLQYYSIAGKFCESGDILGENIAFAQSGKSLSLRHSKSLTISANRFTIE